MYTVAAVAATACRSKGSKGNIPMSEQVRVDEVLGVFSSITAPREILRERSMPMA